jgi:hypothetical protein
VTGVRFLGARAKAKCGGLSTTLRFGRDDASLGFWVDEGGEQATTRGLQDWVGEVGVGFLVVGGLA